MKQLFLLGSLVVVLWTLAGCQHHALSSGSDAAKLTGQKNSFPSFLAGTWEENEYGWQIKFEPNGNISRVRHLFGVDINPQEGGTYEEGPHGAYNLYLFGPCYADYDPNTRTLTVNVILDQYHFEAPEGVGSLEGNSKDVFTGPVSEDGRKWHVKWYSYTELYGAAKHPDANNTEPAELVFRKTN